MILRWKNIDWRKDNNSDTKGTIFIQFDIDTCQSKVAILVKTWNSWDNWHPVNSLKWINGFVTKCKSVSQV